MVYEREKGPLTFTNSEKEQGVYEKGDDDNDKNITGMRRSIIPINTIPRYNASMWQRE